MEKELTPQAHPWTKIPLADYETHMSHQDVGQLALLNLLTKKYLDRIKPKTALFLGIAGGNGLEHIDHNITQQVFGVDINQSYLLEVEKRFANTISGLRLLQIDIGNCVECVVNADFIWAALILEYTGVEKGFNFIVNNISEGGNLLITIQANNGVQAISKTGIESIKYAGELFNLINPSDIKAIAKEKGLTLVEQQESMLPTGKSLITFHFINNVV